MAALNASAMVDVDEKSPNIGRISGGGIETTDGTLYVSKPFRSGTSKKLRAMISFVPRTSHFDTNNLSSGANEFRVRWLACLSFCFHIHFHFII